MGPLYRTFWAVTASAALHVAAVRWGGGLLERETAPPPDKVTISLALFEPAPPVVAPVAAPPAPPAAPVKRRAPERKGALRPRPAAPLARVEAPAQLPDLEAVPVVLPVPPAPPDSPPAAAPAPAPVMEAPPEEARANPAAREDPDDLAFPQSRPDHAALVSSVREGIDAAKRYPRLARQAGFEGRALLKFRLLRSGEVADLRLLESSGHAILDEAALGAVRRAAPFPEEGRKLAGESIEVILPVLFQLHQP